VQTFPGHTAHMQAVIVQSPGENPKTACYISDLIPTSAHIDLTWGMSFDLYPLQTIESKKQYYAKSIPEKWLTVFTHDPKTPWAYVEKDALGKMVPRGV
jgi:glyoxylase-like metal-dependent hydrolase (beta-lactamase superfamily II)